MLVGDFNMMSGAKFLGAGLVSSGMGFIGFAAVVRAIHTGFQKVLRLVSPLR